MDNTSAEKLDVSAPSLLAQVSGTALPPSLAYPSTVSNLLHTFAVFTKIGFMFLSLAAISCMSGFLDSYKPHSRNLPIDFVSLLENLSLLGSVGEAERGECKKPAR